MAPKAKSAAKKAGAKPKATAKENGAGRGRRVEVASKVTLGVDDKRAQYARLVIVNYGHKNGLIPKGTDVNSATKTQLEKAGKALNGGNLLNGKEGIELIQELSKAGATDENVAKRGLTTAYAQEVRPFLRRLTLADSFSRRGGSRKPKEGGNEAKADADAAEEQAEASE